MAVFGMLTYRSFAVDFSCSCHFFFKEYFYLSLIYFFYSVFVLVILQLILFQLFAKASLSFSFNIFDFIRFYFSFVSVNKTI